MFLLLKDNPKLKMDMRKESLSYVFEYMNEIGKNCKISESNNYIKLIVLLFNLLFLGTPSSTSIVDKAIAIQKQYKVTNRKYVVMVDFSKSIDEDRLYIVNTKTAQIEITSIVSHGINSGKQYATDFSNVMESNKSSLGP